MHAPTLRVLLEPRAQSGPLAQQRLMRDLHLARVDRHEPVVRERGQDVGVIVALEFGQRDPAAHDQLALALARKPQEDPARDVALVRIELLVRSLGQSCDRAVDAAGLLVRAQVQAAPVTVLPELQQRCGQQWQRAGLALDVGDKGIDELGLDLESRALRGQLDRAPQLVAAHRTDRNLVRAEQAPELGIARAAPIEVGPDGEQHERSPARVARAGDKRVDERVALVLVAAGGEDLLELVDRDDQATVWRGAGRRLLECSERVDTGSQQRERPVPAARDHILSQRGEQARPQRRRLAAPRGPDDPDQRRTHDARDHLGDQPLATEEDVGVVDVERGEAFERTGDDLARGFLPFRTLAHGLELDDVAGEVVLGRPQARSLRCRPLRRRTQAPYRLRARPLARDLVHALRHAAALLHEALDGNLDVLAGARVRPRHGAHGVGVEWRQRQRCGGTESRHELGLLDRREDEQRQCGELVGSLGERRRQRSAGALGVIDHQQRATALHLGACQRFSRLARARRVQHRAAVVANLGRQLGRETRLAHPARPHDQHQTAVAGARAAPVLAQQVQLDPASDQRRARVELGRELERPGGGRAQPGVLAQDRLVQPAQLGAGLDADLLHQRGPGLTVGSERVGLAARAVQREHPLRMQLLAQRLVQHQRLQLSYNVAMAARIQVDVDRQLHGRQPQLLQPPDLGGGERLTGDVIERRATPQGQCLTRPSACDEPLEACDVELVGAEPQLVPVPAREDLLAVAGRGQRLAQLRHMELHELRGRRRRPLAPQRVDQAIGRDGRAGMERQHRQQRPRLARANSDRPLIDAGLHGSQESDVHCASLCRHYARAVAGSTALYRRCHRRYTDPGEADPRIDRQAIGRRQGAEMLSIPSSWCVTGALTAQFLGGRLRPALGRDRRGRRYRPAARARGLPRDGATGPAPPRGHAAPLVDTRGRSHIQGVATKLHHSRGAGLITDARRGSIA